jgi:hypothetical protein
MHVIMGVPTITCTRVLSVHVPEAYILGRIGVLNLNSNQSRQTSPQGLASHCLYTPLPVTLSIDSTVKAKLT